MEIICIGSTLKDIFFPTDEGLILETPEDLLSKKKIAFELGAKYHIEKRYDSLGGVSANVATGLARLGEQVSCLTAIGDDVIGKWILEVFAKENIGTENVQVVSDCPSDLSAILVDKKSGDRTIFSNRPANHFLKIEKENLPSADWFFLGDLSGQWQEKLDTVITAAQEKNIRVAFNPNQKTIHDDVQKIISNIAACEVFIVNKDEAIEIVSAQDGGKPLDDENKLIEELKKLGAKIVVVTDGERGAWGSDGKQTLQVDAIMQKETVDTTGAGDAFTSGFLAAHLKGRSLEECLKWGIANSSNSVRFYGGQEGLLNVNEITSEGQKMA